MAQLQVLDVNPNYRCTCKNLQDGTTTDLVIALHSTKGVNYPKIGDKITLDDRLLNKSSINYVEPYSFELEQTIDKFEWNVELEDLLLTRHNKKYLFKRIYG